ncbi:sirohydrochlorin cobaltochelatase [Veillonella sp. AS16]|uniref:sirohydrochlorin cobaltochelatase n=1 Tax=Veillonella sp. AS16 TaxID=936589 RepID=UPI0003E25C0E|nr:sirohydrochlorin cobaltochelatase [Veillonella sp. AS16]ETS93820.1 cobalt chelatase CbiK [Veillonella sp. AS16]
MKQAILVVAFGSTVDSAREQNIDSVVKYISQSFPDYTVKLAFSSRIIVKRLRERGITIPTEQGALEQLIQDGYTHVYVQPLHFTGGEEFDKLKHNILAHEGEGQLEVLRVGRPLVYYMAQEEHPDDYQILIDRFIRSLNISDEDGLLLVGHGGLGSGNSSYGNLQFKLIRAGLTNVRVAVLENAPYITDVALPWEWLDGKRPKRIYVHPLLLVLGDHAQNDLFGDGDDSAINEIAAAGYEVEPIHSALGEYDVIHDIFRQHVQDCIDDIYGKRSSHRPAIPNIK